MKYKLCLLTGAALMAMFAQAPATYGDARSRLLRMRSPLSDEQRGDVAVVMATSYACGKLDGKAGRVEGISVTSADCADVLLTIRSSKGTH
jgi:hypothetical protein